MDGAISFLVDHYSRTSGAGSLKSARTIMGQLSDILADAECDTKTRRAIRRAIEVHCVIERTSERFADGIARRWFCERFGTVLEQHGLTMEQVNNC